MDWSEYGLKKDEMFDMIRHMFDARDEAIKQDPARYMGKVVDRLGKIEVLLQRVKYYLGGEVVMFSNEHDPSRHISLESKLLLRQKKAMDIISIYFKDRDLEDRNKEKAG